MSTLIGLYLAGLAFSLALAIVLWRRDRSQLNVDLCALWIAGGISAIVQGACNRGELLIALGFSSTVLTNLALARLIARLAALTLPFRFYLALYGVGVVTALATAAAGAPFWALALPIALTAPFAALHAGVQALRASSAQLGATGKAFIYTSFAFVAHNLDFPFLRMRPELGSLGLVIALFLVWTLAPTAMAAVLERTAEERGRLVALEAAKSRFFANVSHELRTPLTLIVGPLSRLVAEEPAGPRRRSLELMQRNAQRLLRMIDDLLDLARVEAGKLQLKLARCDLTVLIRGVCELSEPAALAREVRLETVLPSESIWLSGDSHRIEIIVGNLLSNAIKYTQVGGRVRASLSADDTQVRLVVSDDGPGIAVEDQARIFERFVRLGPTEKTTKGVGIGLALSRELAEAHGGTLSVQSRPGEGATFVLSLPRAQPAQLSRDVSAAASSLTGAPASRAELTSSLVAPEDAGPIRLEGGRVPQVLIVEDEPDMRGFIAQIIGAEFECHAVEHGEEAWQRLATFRPDLVVSDVMMPTLSGLELCARIKADASLRAMPVMLLTARMGVEAAIEGYAAGADDFLSKPFHPRELLAHVRSHLRVRQLALQLADQARLAASGTLAAGVAHEIRNPLNAALNALSALADPETSVGREELLAVATDGMKRIQVVTDALNVHVRPAEGARSAPCRVRDAVEATLRLLRHRAQHVVIHLDLPADLEFFAPASAFNQALLNLLDNGLRAAKSGLWVTLRGEGRTLKLAIEDDGPGIPPALQERVFDPFFTTRDVGEGMGLGLHLSRQLAREAGGELHFEANVRGGARFVLTLPSLGQALAS